MRIRYEEKAAHANEHLEGTLVPHEDAFLTSQRLQREIIAAQRSAVIRLRDQGQIDDEVLRTLERELDLEEQRFAVQE
jgi:CPA1 family monovalent cation:H+ antiporter